MARAHSTSDFEAAARKAEAGERVLVRRPDGGRVAVVPAEDLAQLEELEDAADVAASKAAMAEGPGRPWSEVRKKYGLA